MPLLHTTYYIRLFQSYIKADIGTAQVSLPPLLESSELVVVRYALPFGLSAEPQDGQVIVTKNGKEKDGEKVGK